MEIKNYYAGMKKPSVDKQFKHHLIQPNSRIALIGGSGSGKTNVLLDFLNRKNESFYDIIIFTSNAEEPLMIKLKQEMPDVQIYTDINDVPEPYGDVKEEKLIVFDDFITLSKKEMKTPIDYAIAGRKKGWTTMYMSQDYKSIPKTILRQINYFILFKLNDNISIDNVIRNHNIDGIDKHRFKEMYLYATQQPRNFFMLDLLDPRYRFRHNFLEIL